MKNTGTLASESVLFELTLPSAAAPPAGCGLSGQDRNSDVASARPVSPPVTVASPMSGVVLLLATHADFEGATWSILARDSVVKVLELVGDGAGFGWKSWVFVGASLSIGSEAQ